MSLNMSWSFFTELQRPMKREIKNYSDYEWNKAKIEEEQKRRSNTARIHISFAKERKGCNAGKV